MNVTKTPPSLLFVLMTVGPAFLFLRAADSSTPSFLRPALTIGRVPMFYYVAHVLVLHLIVTIEALARYGSAAIVTQSPTLDRFPFTQPPGWAAPATDGLRGMGAGRRAALSVLPLVCALQGASTTMRGWRISSRCGHPLSLAVHAVATSRREIAIIPSFRPSSRRRR